MPPRIYPISNQRETATLQATILLQHSSPKGHFQSITNSTTVSFPMFPRRERDNQGSASDNSESRNRKLMILSLKNEQGKAYKDTAKLLRGELDTSASRGWATSILCDESLASFPLEHNAPHVHRIRYSKPKPDHVHNDLTRQVQGRLKSFNTKPFAPHHDRKAQVSRTSSTSPVKSKEHSELEIFAQLVHQHI